MATPKRPHRGHRLGLPWAARKYLLGARPFYDDGGEGVLRNSGIWRLCFLVVKAKTEEDWRAYLADLQAEWGPVVRAKRAVWRERKAVARKAAQEARQRAREAARRAKEASRVTEAPRSPPT
jgi:hypothetical protein